MLQLLVAVVRMTTVSTSVTVASLTICTTGMFVLLVVDVPDWLESNTTLGTRLVVVLVVDVPDWLKSKTTSGTGLVVVLVLDVPEWLEPKTTSGTGGWPREEDVPGVADDSN